MEITKDNEVTFDQWLLGFEEEAMKEVGLGIVDFNEDTVKKLYLEGETPEEAIDFFVFKFDLVRS